MESGFQWWSLIGFGEINRGGLAIETERLPLKINVRTLVLQVGEALISHGHTVRQAELPGLFKALKISSFVETTNTKNQSRWSGKWRLLSVASEDAFGMTMAPIRHVIP